MRVKLPTFDFLKQQRSFPIKLTVYNKMMLGFCSIIALMVVSSVYILIELDNVSDSAKISLSSHVSSIDLAKRLKTILFDEESHANKYFISQDKFYLELFAESSGRFTQLLKRFRNIQSEEHSRSLVNNIEVTHNWLVSRLHQNVPEFGSEELSKLQQEWRNSTELLHRSLEHIIGLNQLAIGNSMAQVDAVTSRSAHVALFLVVCTMLIALLIASIISRTITRPIGDLIKGTKKIAEGKFEQVDVSTADEVRQLAESFNKMSKKLKEVNEIKAEMMHQISHELRTPLQATISAIDVLETKGVGELNEKQVAVLSTIKDSTRAILSYSDQYLDIAKVDAGMMPYNTKRIDILKVINKAIADLQPIADKKGITIAISISTTGLPAVVADAEKIRIALRNLIGNAIKFSEQNAQVEIGLKLVGSEIKIDIKDSGIGIAPEEISHVFEKFYRATNAARFGGRGTGLGLAITKAFIEGHGGRISVSSKLNKGSTFSILLPIIAHSPKPLNHAMLHKPSLADN